MHKHYLDVAVGDIVHSHGVPLVVQTEPVAQPREGVMDGTVVWFSGIYRGPDLTSDSGLWPFVRKDGDQWTFQRAFSYAALYSYDDGKTWHQV